MRVEASEGREIIVANDAGCQRDLLDPDAWHGPARPSCSCGRAFSQTSLVEKWTVKVRSTEEMCFRFTPEVDGMAVPLLSYRAFAFSPGLVFLE